MAQILWNLFNHNDIGKRSLEDPLAIISNQLMALGHTVHWDRDAKRIYRENEGTNFVVEGFTRGDKGSIKAIADAYNNGARFICIATEEPTPKGFNHGTSKEMAMRQDTFREAAPYLQGILYLVPGDYVHRWYNEQAPAEHIELGYAPTLLRADMGEPKWDFGFFGSASKRRLKILRTLANRVNGWNAVRTVFNFLPQEQRDAAMKECKVIVQVRKFEEMGLVSSSRINTSICIGRPVVAEPHLLSKPWDEVVDFTKTLDEFYMRCLAVKAAWRGVHEHQFEKFKTKLSPEFCIGLPLRKIGIESPRMRTAA